MAALIKKAPALLATAKEVAVPKLNTFWRYAKVELAPPSPADIPVAIGDLSTKIANLQKQSFRSWTVSRGRSVCRVTDHIFSGQPDSAEHRGGGRGLLLVLHRRVYREGQSGGISGVGSLLFTFDTGEHLL